MLRASVMAAITAATLIGGCAAERDPIDRTQPNGLTKELFQGEWYYQQTVIDIPGTWSFTFVGETNWNGMERVRWDIEQDWLYARRSFEKIKNAEGGVDNVDPNTDKPYVGAILAAYRIDSHFDLKRAYNPSTGEEYNVLEENTSDNPWYDREYFRVDWSANYATEFMFLVDDVTQDPVAYYVQDPADPDYPVFDPGQYDADGRMVRQPYIDVTNTVMTQPGMTFFEEIGETYPTCWLFSRATADCTTEIIKVRSSFLRIDPAHEYVAKPYKGTITDFFGLFAQDRMVFDPLREVNELYRERYANLHNLWLEWLDENGELIENPGNRGGVRPMIYYVHNWPGSLQGALRQTESEWDAIFKRAVSAATGQAYEGRVFVACNWPLQEGDDPTLCVPAEYQLGDGTIDPAFNPRLGDVRYNWIAYVDKYYDGFALLGLGPSNTDPLTGEVLSAGAYLYIYNDVVTQTTTDQIRLLNGDLDALDYIDARDMEGWSENQKAQARTMQQRVVPTDIVGDVAAMQIDNTSWSKGLLGGAPASEWAQWEGKPMREVLRNVMPAAREVGMFNPDYDDSEGRLQSLQGTPIEDMMLNDEIKLAAGIMPGSDLGSFTDEMMRKASAARLGPVKVMAAIEKKKQYFANVKNVDLMASADDGYIGLANQYEGMDEEVLFEVIRDDVFHAVLAHELGHSFNLHHNFGGTEDVLNYKDEYWTMRDDGNVGPRWQDPISNEELDGRIYAYAYSSIMDYSRLTLDAFGPGKYDAAAVLLGYGDKVETYVDTGSAPIDYFNEWSTGRGGILLFFLDQPRSWHYTQWFASMGHDLHDDANRAFVDAKDIDWGTGMASDGVTPRVPYIYCSPYSSDIGNGCFTRDYGADEYERVQHHIALANTWYVTRGFTRYAVGASPEEYVGRTYERTYRRLKGYNDYYALIIGLLQSIGAWDDASIQAFLTDPTEGWASYTIAEHDLFNFLLETIMRPNIDAFSMGTDGAGEQYLISSITGVGQRTGMNSGRYFSTTWWDSVNNDECGMYFWECLHRYGFYLDKVMALEALTDANTYFVARDTAEDVRQWRISFYDNFAPQLNAFMGGVMSQDYSEVAPGYLVGDNLAFPDYALMTPKTSGQTIDPAAGFTVQLYAAVLGMARFQNNFDKSFLDDTRTWLAGSAFGVDSADTCEFVSPRLGGKTYRAIAKPDGNGVAQRMIGRANAVLARSSDCGDSVACVPGLTAADIAKANAELARYTELLDVMVDLTGYYETFTQGYGDPYNPGQVP